MLNPIPHFRAHRISPYTSQKLSKPFIAIGFFLDTLNKITAMLAE